MSIFKLVTRYSVRTRIIALAIIPVIGFLADSVFFTLGETEVADAFATVKKASMLVDEGQEFKDALAVMRISARDFATQPGEDRTGTFEESYRRAINSLIAIELALPVSE